jgi:membrane protein DedA with SNARE-associated domain
MSLEETLDFFRLLAGDPLVLGIAIALFTFVLEDAATVASGLLSAEGLIHPLWALGALYMGIVLGDFGLYGFGRLARENRWARRLLEKRSVTLTRAWMGKRYFATVFGARFVPGLRLPTYTACGFFDLSFPRFALYAAVAAAAWTTLLFIVIFTFGRWAVEELGPWRWALGLAIVLAILFVPRLFSRRAETPGA